MPAIAIAVEAALVVLGAWLYWRAAAHVTKEAGKGHFRAALASALVLASGVCVLYLDAAGLFG